MLKFNFKKGFTLLEALVATSILMVAVAAPITIAQKGLSSAVYSKNQMIASYLAQDAIEYIKNVRDALVIGGNEWLDEFGVCKGDNTFCEIDTVNGFAAGVNIRTSQDQLMKKKMDNNGYFEFYNYDLGDQTNFTRKINIQTQQINGKEDQALITVTVTWNGGEVIVKTLIFNI